MPISKPLQSTNTPNNAALVPVAKDSAAYQAQITPMTAIPEKFRAFVDSNVTVILKMIANYDFTERDSPLIKAAYDGTSIPAHIIVKTRAALLLHAGASITPSAEELKTEPQQLQQVINKLPLASMLVMLNEGEQAGFAHFTLILTEYLSFLLQTSPIATAELEKALKKLSKSFQFSDAEHNVNVEVLRQKLKSIVDIAHTEIEMALVVNIFNKKNIQQALTRIQSMSENLQQEFPNLIKILGHSFLQKNIEKAQASLHRKLALFTQTAARLETVIPEFSTEMFSSTISPLLNAIKEKPHNYFCNQVRQLMLAKILYPQSINEIEEMIIINLKALMTYCQPIMKNQTLVSVRQKIAETLLHEHNPMLRLDQLNSDAILQQALQILSLPSSTLLYKLINNNYFPFFTTDIVLETAEQATEETAYDETELARQVQTNAELVLAILYKLPNVETISKARRHEAIIVDFNSKLAVNAGENAQTVRHRAVALFTKKLSKIQEAEDVEALYIAAHPVINGLQARQNPFYDMLSGKKNSKTWCLVMKSARRKSLAILTDKVKNLLATKASFVNDPQIQAQITKASQQLHKKLKIARQLTSVAEHRRQSFLFSWGRTAAQQEIDNLIACLEKHLPQLKDGNPSQQRRP